MNKLTFAIFIIACCGLVYSCGGNNKSSEKENSSDASMPAENSHESSNKSMTEIASDSKGVGPIEDFDLRPFDPQLAKKGADIFTNKCMVCHKVDTKLIGPALKGVTKIRTPEWILNMMLNPDGMLQNDPVAKKLLLEFNTPMNNQGLTKDDAEAVLEFLRQVDGAGSN